MTRNPVSNQARPAAETVRGGNQKKFQKFWKSFAAGLFIFLFGAIALSSAAYAQNKINDENPLALPAVGDFALHILSPRMLELQLITTKAPDPARVKAWDFISSDFTPSLPSPAEFVVTVDGQKIGITQVGFKRRVLSAPEHRDLRIGNAIYLALASPIDFEQQVEVTNPSGTLWKTPVRYTARLAEMRLSPAVHVNQVGYMPTYTKKAMVGYYLGSLGELSIAAGTKFQIIDADTEKSAYEGTLTARPDVGFIYSPMPYQKILEADFTALETPGEYRLYVPGLGCSYPFRVDEGITANFARTFSLGLYHQRCGTDNTLPYTRHTHDTCHFAPAEIPTMDARYASTQKVLGTVTEDYAENARHTAPRLSSVDASLYPFVNRGVVEISGGHHDAGDYSKYTINSAGLIHFLVFAADSFPGVGALDNLGLPESGDGKSDLLQEAKWEADFLSKMQDADGGFYFLVYPRERRYENNVLPENGDPQVVWPKNTAVTAAAVGALAEAGSSPLMKAQFPQEAAKYREKAQRGWNFLMNAIARFGKDGSYQKITHYGNEFMHDDELAWAAAAMYVATGDSQYQSKLFEFLPDPNTVETRRWTWWRLFEGYGCAVRTYAFAARSGRLPSTSLDAAYLAKCEREIIITGNDHTRFSNESAYGTSLPDTTKQYRAPGWYFSSERAFDVTVAYQLQPRTEYRDTVIANINYEGGCNPLNMTFVTGMGSKRQREIVSQYAWNDRRVLPPAGLPQGNVRMGYGYLETYLIPGTTRNELPQLSYPPDSAQTGPYALYDRWTDMIDTTSEFVVMDLGRSLASLAFWMTQSPAGSTPWKPVLGQISGLEAGMQADKPTSLRLTAPGLRLSTAQVLWEARFLEPRFGNPAAITPKHPGDHWIEAEAVLPDGRRIVAVTNFIATASASEPPNRYQSVPLAVTDSSAALYHFDGDLKDATEWNGPFVLDGNAHLEASNVAWMKERRGAALRFLDLGDRARTRISTDLLRNSDTTEIVLEAMIYVNEFKAFDRGIATIMSLVESYNDSYLEFREDKYMGPVIQAGNLFSFGGKALSTPLTTKKWHHMSISISKTGYSFKLDGILLASLPSGELINWGRVKDATLVLGDFDGWIDELVIRNVGNTSHSSDSSSVLRPIAATNAGFRLQVAGQPGITYDIEASENGVDWTNVGTVTLTERTAEFLDATSGPKKRFYRAAVQP